MRAPALASLLLLLLTACGSKAATTTTPVPPDDPAGAGSGSSGATAAAACGPAVAALMGPVNKQLRDGLPPELVDVWVPRFLAVMTTSCQEDGWSAEGVRCLTEAKGDPEIEACNAKLDTPELAKQLEARMKPLLQEFAAAVQQAMLRKTVAQVPAPFPAKAPPADLVATSSGLRYRKGAAAPATEAAIGGNDTIVADVTEWNLAGDTVANEHGGRYQLPQQSAGMAEAIRRYWPELPDGALAPDYTGIRPKLAPAGGAATDFVIEGPESHGLAGLVNLFGIESPGLTASLAIAEEVLDRVRGGNAAVTGAPVS